MKKLILILVLTLGAYASEVSWFHSYPEAIKAAKSEHKPLLLFMNKPGCGSCAYMKENVFTDEKIIDYLTKNYIAVSLDIHKNDAPKEFQVQVTPVFHYINGDGKKIRETLVGGKTAPFFLKLLKQAEKNNK